MAVCVNLPVILQECFRNPQNASQMESRASAIAQKVLKGLGVLLATGVVIAAAFFVGALFTGSIAASAAISPVFGTLLGVIAIPVLATGLYYFSQSSHN